MKLNKIAGDIQQVPRNRKKATRIFSKVGQATLSLHSRGVSLHGSTQQQQRHLVSE